MPQVPYNNRNSVSHTRKRSDSYIKGMPIGNPTNPRATLRMTPKNSPLKLITNFEKKPEDEKDKVISPADQVLSSVGRFFGWSDKNSKNAVSTPIAASAISPTEGGSTAFPFPRSLNSSLNVQTPP